MRLPALADTGFVDGRRARLDAATIAIDDPAFHAGLGVFETLAVNARRAIDLDEHLERLSAGAARLALALPASNTLRQTLSAAADEQTTDWAWLKIVVTGGGRWFVFGGPLDPSEIGRPVSAVLLPWSRNPGDALAGLKTLNYAPNALGTAEARRRGADEGLWCNTRGHLAEGCASNVFVLGRRRVFTPGPRDGILAGVVRGFALRAARDLGFAVHEGRIRLVRLERAREAFLTSSLTGVRPLVEYERRPVGSGTPGAATLAIAARVAELRGLERDPRSVERCPKRTS